MNIRFIDNFDLLAKKLENSSDPVLSNPSLNIYKNIRKKMNFDAIDSIIKRTNTENLVSEKEPIIQNSNKGPYTKYLEETLNMCMQQSKEKGRKRNDSIDEKDPYKNIKNHKMMYKNPFQRYIILFMDSSSPFTKGTNSTREDMKDSKILKDQHWVGYLRDKQMNQKSLLLHNGPLFDNPSNKKEATEKEDLKFILKHMDVTVKNIFGSF